MVAAARLNPSITHHRRSVMAKKKNARKVAKKVSAETIYKIIEVVGTSPKSWEEAAANAVEVAGRTLRDLRIAEVVKMDMKVDGGKVVAFRTRVLLSFKYDT
jgi:flavin-binding protein dodecin